MWNVWHLTYHAALEHERKVSLRNPIGAASTPLNGFSLLHLASFFCPKSVFAFGVLYTLFVECFFTFSKCSLHIFLRVEKIQLQNQRALFTTTKQSKKGSAAATVWLLWSWRNCDASCKKNAKVWKAKVCSKKTNTTCRQWRVKGCRCGLNSTSNWYNTHIWVTHTHTQGPFVCTLNQHFFVIGEQ